MSHQLLQELTENDLPELLNILNPVASNYFALGLQLNIQNSRICNIEHNHSTCEDRLRAVIVERLNQEEPLTLHDIVTALKTPSVNKSELARFIETQYLAAYQSPSSVTRHEKVLRSPDFQPHTALTTSTPTLSQVSANPSQTFQSQQHSLQFISKQLPAHHTFRPFTPHTIDQVLSSNQPQSHPHSNYLSPNVSTSNTQLQSSHTTFNYTPTFQQPDSYLYSYHPQPDDTKQLYYTQLPSSHRQQCMYTTPTSTPFSMQAKPSQYPSSHHTSLSPTTYRDSVLEAKPPSAKRPRKDMRSQSEPQSVPSQYQNPGNSRLTPVQQFIEFVKRTYKYNVVESDTSVVKWPPTPSQVYINLACIDRKRVMSNSEDYDKLTKNMVEYGDMDAIRTTKGPIEFSEIAKDIFITSCGKDTAMSSRRLIIVEGAPGVGKSTFAWEYCRKWERGEIAEQYQLVLLLRLRDNTISEAKSLNDLIYHPLDGVPQGVCEELVHSHNLRTLIILEGFDELPDHCRKGSSVFNDLISGKMLPSATILVTSRPWATQRIRTKHEGRIYQHIEVLYLYKIS